MAASTQSPTLTALPTLDEIAATPERARELPPAVKRKMVRKCAVILIALSETDSDPLPPVFEPKGRAQKGSDRPWQTQLLTVTEVAPRLGFAESYVYELLRRGVIRRIKLGKYVRVTRKAVDDFIAKREQFGLADLDMHVHHQNRDGRAGKTAAKEPAADARAVRRQARRESGDSLEVGERAGGNLADGGAVDPSAERGEPGRVEKEI